MDPRFLADSNREVYTGTELLLKGALETEKGVHLITGYPAQPIAAFFEAVDEVATLLDERGVVNRIANNESLAVAMAMGCRAVGGRALVVLSGSGVRNAINVLANATWPDDEEEGGGVVVVCGDDPAGDPLSVSADSREIAKQVRLPMIEPANPQEDKDWVNVAFQMSRAARTSVALRVTAQAARGGATVQTSCNHFPASNANAKVPLARPKGKLAAPGRPGAVGTTAESGDADHVGRQGTIHLEARRLGVNRVLHRPQRGEIEPYGFVAAGRAFAYLTHALEEMDLAGKVPILKLGMTCPLDDQLLLEFARQCASVVVVEEGPDFVERELRDILSRRTDANELKFKVWGKRFPDALEGIPETGSLSPSVLVRRLIPLILSGTDVPVEYADTRMRKELDRMDRTGLANVPIVSRSPTFCTGCPHRDSASVLLELKRNLADAEYMDRVHNLPPVSLSVHGDGGCHSLLRYEPFDELNHGYVGRGLSGAAGVGTSFFADNKQLALVGDGSFFHSGLSAVSQSILMAQDITYIVLDNNVSAMAGLRYNPGSRIEAEPDSDVPDAQSIERIVRGMAPESREAAVDVRVFRVNPADRKAYRNLLERAILSEGVKVVVADKECGVTFHRRKRRERERERQTEGFVAEQTYMNVCEAVCENCLECVKQVACPALKHVDTDYGSKIQTDLTLCVNDGACDRLDVCPSFEQITVTRRMHPRGHDDDVDLRDIPNASPPISANQTEWRVHIAGVGGSGVSVATRILVHAGRHMGYAVKFHERRSNAVRFAGIAGQIVFTREGKEAATTSNIPIGRADLLLGIDLMESVRAVDVDQTYRVAGNRRTACVLNTHWSQTFHGITAGEVPPIDSMIQAVHEASHQDRFQAVNVGGICEHLLESRLYSNVMLLGMSYQQGFVPLTLDAVEHGIRNALDYDYDRNLRAFHIGRLIACDPDRFTQMLHRKPTGLMETIRLKVRVLRERYPGSKGRRLGRTFCWALRPYLNRLREAGLDESLRRDFVVRFYDCLVWGLAPYAKVYADLVMHVLKLDSTDHGNQLVRLAIRNLAKVMLIKDEVYVASLLTDPEKYRRDMERFRVDPRRGDRIRYTRRSTPEISAFGRSLRFEWTSGDWQLRILSRQRWLRSVLVGWHARDEAFRDWYQELVRQIEWEDEASYARWCDVLRAPESVSGFREVRYHKIEAARAAAEQLLRPRPEADATNDPDQEDDAGSAS